MSKVIMYHYIRNFNKKQPYFNFLHFSDFKKQNNFLEKKSGFIKITDDLEKSCNKNKFLLTFDDGLKEHLKVAKYLKQKNIMGIFFIPGMQIEKSDFLPIHKIHLIFGKYDLDELISIFKKFKVKINFEKHAFSIFEKQKNFLEKKNWLTENDRKIYLKTQLNNLDQKNKQIVKKIFNYCFSKSEQIKIFKNFYLNSKDIKSLDKFGMKIGAHGYGHKVLSKLDYNSQKKDIFRSIKILSKILNKKIKYFCYPYGGFKVFNNNTIKILQKKKLPILLTLSPKIGLQNPMLFMFQDMIVMSLNMEKSLKKDKKGLN